MRRSNVTAIVLSASALACGIAALVCSVIALVKSGAGKRVSAAEYNYYLQSDDDDLGSDTLAF